jgi:predicted NBD/HSP70 family sugar kinase
MPGWHGFPIRERMQALWGKPVRLLNDADLGALGEHAFGAARGLQDMVYIKVGTGIGAGFLLGGHVYLGATGAAGEIGHITLDPEGPLCTCGNRGCLEAMAGGAALARRAIQAIRAGTPTVLAHHAPLESLTARDIGEAAHRGDHMSQQLLADAGRLIGISAATLVNLVNPQMLVVGGGVAQVGDLLLSPIRDAVRRRSLRASAEVVQVQAALLGRRSTAMGAVALAQHHAVRMLAGCPT